MVNAKKRPNKPIANIGEIILNDPYEKLFDIREELEREFLAGQYIGCPGINVIFLLNRNARRIA